MYLCFLVNTSWNVAFTMFMKMMKNWSVQFVVSTFQASRVWKFTQIHSIKRNAIFYGSFCKASFCKASFSKKNWIKIFFPPVIMVFLRTSWIDLFYTYTYFNKSGSSNNLLLTDVFKKTLLSSLNNWMYRDRKWL